MQPFAELPTPDNAALALALVDRPAGRAGPGLDDVRDRLLRLRRAGL